ncbi:TetR/AcrR family transcriptional regulator [Flavobacterium sp. xlx-214]|uniref:TetR/AcrR family transcriptional regulator n=1 Tax=unclassified Flavobacterium TaxID=196869 RepID=UPI0013D2E62F|nr:MULTISPECIES: TetR/AcrR family transcriptional regulator [unclassified Flavobacterium]MBA5792302.1 TetR/AcrR family transcriptional regulator [Flavobacterium sp. xlx-221]QMI82381.1 TetR/AcrR family transcriptional regulator [Flavobacterium sp. xlx-214]
MKETILKKSLLLFTQHGFKSITMDDIAKELGISKKTIYQHFASKNELVKATVDYVFEAATNKMKALIGKCETPIHEHFAMKNCVGELFGYNIQASTVYQFNKYYPKLAERIQQKRHDDYDLTILRNLKDGVKNGYYRKEIDIDFVGKVFFSSSTAFFNDESFINMQNTQSIDELNYKFLEYHLRGIVTTKGLEILEQLLKPHTTNEI